MKKENIVKKLFTSSLIGFPIGVTLLILSYAGIFCIVGEDAANKELLQLNNIRTLVYQAMVMGLAYFIVFVNLNTALLFLNRETTIKFTYKHPCISVLLLLLSVLGMIISLNLINIESIYSKNVAMLNVIIMVIIYAVACLVFMIKDVKENLLVKKINIKIKEKNENNN
ncbi:MAG: hypothetical protein J5881_02310 [Clostridia bacterium]|nr:hypothetical protein [Clostridia bacterium]